MMSLMRARNLASTPLPGIAGPPRNHFVGEKWVAFAIVLAVVVLLTVWRRWAAASRAGWPLASALWYGINPFAPPPLRTKRPEAKGLLVGTDNRMSTSKATAALWIVVMLYLIVAILLIVISFDESSFAAMFTISPLYLAFLGGPFVAAVLAKAAVSYSLGSRQAQKSMADIPRVADVFSDDDGNIDLIDTQYILFNLLVATIVVVLFVREPGYDAPTLPGFLAILTGASAVIYVINKALATGNRPTLDRVAPQTARQGAGVIAYGANFIAQGDNELPTVFINGIEAPTSGRAQQDQVTFRIPVTTPLGSATVSIRTPTGLEATCDTQLTIVQDEVVITNVVAVDIRPGCLVTFGGAGFYNANDVDANGVPITATAVPARITLIDTSGSQHPCDPAPNGNSDSMLTVSVPKGLQTGWHTVNAARGPAQVSINPPISLDIT